MDEREFHILRDDCERVLNSFLKYLNNERDETLLYGLKAYIDETKEKKGNWSIEKIQVIFMVIQSKNPSEIQEIISYFDHSGYGWQGDEYKFYSRCSWGCRKNHRIDNTPEMTEQVFWSMDEIFLHKEYGAITTYLFAYCIASLFSSKLKEKRCAIPYFLQIACKRNSNVYRLVHEIVHICDINTGLFDACKKYEYGECDHDHLTLYPSGTGDSLLETLLYYRDIPIIVDGYENEKLYEVLIREVANIPRKIKRLDIKARFNILPVFISPAIQSRFRNVFSIDLTEMDIADEYLDLILENKQCLGSWALELVNKAKEYFDKWNSTAYSQQKDKAKMRESRDPEKQTPLFHDLTEYINRLRSEHNRETKLTSKDINNIGYLSYFLSYYMKVFRRSLRIYEGEAFEYRGIKDKHSPEKLIYQIVEQATDSLFRLHGVCSPALPETLNIDIDASDEKRAKEIEKKGAGYVKDIVKYYQSYKVSIRISNVKYKDERYVFYIKPLPGTDIKLLNRYADEVKRLMEVEFFALDITPGEIKLVVSENPLHENSLIKILESTQFKESEMEIPYAVGYDVMGKMVIADVTEFPHLLIGGGTKSGKSSAIHSLLMSIIYKQSANKVKLLLFDFGASDIKVFDKVPHMLRPTIRSNEIEKGRDGLRWLQAEMEKRLIMKDSLEVRKFTVEMGKWQSIVCVIDEFPAFIRALTAEKHNKKAYTIIEDLLERARKVKIHLVLAAQGSTKDNIEIRTTNLGGRIAFKCNNRYESQAIIESSDAVDLSGKGVMYFKSDQHEGLMRIQGAYMPVEEIADILDELYPADSYSEKWYDEMEFQINSSQEPDKLETTQNPFSTENEDEKLLFEMVMWMQGKENISNNQLKNNFEMGYERANRFLARLEDAGIISKQKKGTKLPRTVDQNKIEEFLENHGYVEDTNKEDWVKCLEQSSMQNDMEPRREQDIKLNNGEAGIKNSATDSNQELIKVVSQVIKKRSDRCRSKKRPAR